ncbi:MAG: hypothetical protein CFE36_00705 [Sphingomonadaceae bacterium PASS1]|nr:MAG: hypothetical protein CFE36_00705 [Sphingomonadaceae bacterium PASS1]
MTMHMCIVINYRISFASFFYGRQALLIKALQDHIVAKLMQRYLRISCKYVETATPQTTTGRFDGK